MQYVLYRVHTATIVDALFSLLPDHKPCPKTGFCVIPTIVPRTLPNLRRQYKYATLTKAREFIRTTASHHKPNHSAMRTARVARNEHHPDIKRITARHAQTPYAITNVQSRRRKSLRS